MPEKKELTKFSYIYAFLLGITIMVLIYVVFDKTRSIAAPVPSVQVDTNVITTNPETGQIYLNGTSIPITKVGSTDTTVVVSPVYLGVEIMPIDANMAKALSLSSDVGVLVNLVMPDSPAQKAGLKRGDVIVALDNKPVKDVETFKALLAKYKPGDKVKITYIRNGSRASAYAYLVALPALQKTASTQDAAPSGWGISLSPLSQVIRTTFNIPANITGIAIVAVEPGGVADTAGLKAGDVIMSVDKTAVYDLESFFNAISADRNNTALLDVYSQGTTRYVPIDSTSIKLTATTTPTTLGQKLATIFTKGAPISPGSMVQTADTTTAVNRPTTVPGDTNTGGSSGSTTGMNRPSQVPSQSSGSNNDVVFFIGLLLLVILYLAYREYHRPPDPEKE